MSWKTLDQARRDIIIELYAGSALTVDDLPYTPEFDRLLETFNARAGATLTHHDFWRAISSARKTGQLTRKER